MRNVLVSGASRGLGLAMATRLVADGFRVIAVARASGEDFGSAERECAGALHFRACDLAAQDGIPALVASVTREFGPLYGLVNNAGLGTGGILATMPEAQIDALLSLNVAAPIKLAKQAVRSMMVGKSGRIVNVSSIVASNGFTGLSVYAATKAALNGFTLSLAREVGKLGITVNSVAPGFIPTAMTQDLTGAALEKIAARSALRRLATPADVAHAVSYLMSDGAGNVTGTIMTVDAGGTA